MKKAQKIFSFIFKDFPLDQNIDIESSDCKTLESLQNLIFENFELTKDQYEIINPPSDTTLKTQKKFVVEINIKKKCKDVTFIFPDEEEITIKNCIEMDFKTLLNAFRKKGIYFSRMCTFNILYFSLFGLEIPFDYNYFTCVPRGTSVHFVMKGKTVILKYHDYKFILSDFETVKEALDLIQTAFTKCKTLSIMNTLNERLEPDEKLRSKNNGNYKIVAKHKFTFASINNYKKELSFDYLETVEGAKQFLSKSVCSSEIDVDEILILDKDKDEVTDLDTKLIDIMNEKNQIYFKFSDDSDLEPPSKPKSQPSVRRKRTIELFDSNKQEKKDEQNKKVGKRIKKTQKVYSSDEDEDEEKQRFERKDKKKVGKKKNEVEDQNKKRKGKKFNEEEDEEEEKSDENDWENEKVDPEFIEKLRNEMKKENKKENDFLNHKINPKIYEEYMKNEEEEETDNAWLNEKVDPEKIKKLIKKCEEEEDEEEEENDDKNKNKNKKIKNIVKEINKINKNMGKREDKKKPKKINDTTESESDDDKSEDENTKPKKAAVVKAKTKKLNKADDNKNVKSKYNIRYNGKTEKIEMKDDSSLADNENKIKEKFEIEDEKILEYYIYESDDDEDDIIDEPENVIMKNYKNQKIKIKAVEDKNGGDLKSRISKKNASGEELLTVYYQIGVDDETLKKDIKSTDKVIDFKKLIQEDERVDNIDDIKILYAGKDLLDDIVIKSLNIGGDPLYVYIRQTDDLLLMTAKALRV